MQAMLATWKDNSDPSQFETDNALQGLSDTLSLKVALTGLEKDKCIRKHWVRANRALRGLGGPKAPRGLRAQGDKP